MEQRFLAITIGIFITGMISGIFSGISLKTGEGVDPESIMLNVLRAFCNSLKDIWREGYSSCGLTFMLISLVVLIFGIIEIILTASKIGNFWLGLGVYFLGFVLGLIILLVG